MQYKAYLYPLIQYETSSHPNLAFAIQRDITCIKRPTSFALNNNPPSHTLPHLPIKLHSLTARKTDLFTKIIRQQIQQILIASLIQQRFVCELCVLV